MRRVLAEITLGSSVALLVAGFADNTDVAVVALFALWISSTALAVVTLWNDG